MFVEIENGEANFLDLVFFPHLVVAISMMAL